MTSNAVPVSSEAMVAAGPISDRYPGARPFEDDDIDRELFRGRKKEAQELLHLILAEPWVVLYGRSGVGKSSLLGAGVMAELRREGYLPLRVRLNDPDAGPVGAFLDGINQSVRRQDVDFVKGEGSSLSRWFATAEFWAEDDLLTPVIILDQFEELFALHGQAQRQAFIDELAQLLRGPPASPSSTPGETKGAGGEARALKVVCAIREDFLGELEELAPKIPSILNTRFRLTPMSREAAAQAIREPAALEDRRLRTSPFEYESGLVDVVLDFLGKPKEAGERLQGDEIEPFQLQIICRHVEGVAQARQAAGVRHVVIDRQALGGEVGLREVLERFYEDEVGRIATASRARSLFSLCEQGLISSRGRRLSLEEGEIEARFKVTSAALGRLVDGRILRAEPRVGSVYYELSHDSLIRPILASRERRTRARRSRRRRARRGVGVTLLVAVAGYYFWQLRPTDRITVSPETTHIVAPLKPNGLPDYVAAFNERYGGSIKPGDNAAADLLAVVGTSGTSEDELRANLGVEREALGRSPRFVGGVGEAQSLRELLAPTLSSTFSDAAFGSELERALAAPWSEGECPLVAAWLRANEVALARAKAASAKPRFWIPASSRGGLVGRPLLHLRRLRNLLSALRARAQWRVQAGDEDAAADDLVVALRLADLMEQGPTSFEKFYGATLTRSVSDGLASLASSAGLTAAKASALARGLRSLERASPNYKEVLGTAERWMILDAIVQEYELRRAEAAAVASDDPTGKTGSAPRLESELYGNLSLPRWIVIDWNELMRRTNRQFDRFVADTGPEGGRKRLEELMAEDARYPSPWRFLISPRNALVQRALAMATPNYIRGRIIGHESSAALSLAQLSLDLAAYRGQTGGFPASLKEAAELPLGAEEARFYRIAYRPLEPRGRVFGSFALLAVGAGEFEDMAALCVDPTGRIVRYQESRSLTLSDGPCPSPPGRPRPAGAPR